MLQVKEMSPTLILSNSEILPHRHFLMKHTNLLPILSRVSHRNVLQPTLNLIYMADLSTTQLITVATFADDSAIQHMQIKKRYFNIFLLIKLVIQAARLSLRMEITHCCNACYSLLKIQLKRSSLHDKF